MISKGNGVRKGGRGGGGGQIEGLMEVRTNRGNDGNGRMGGGDDGKGRRIDKMTGWEDEYRECRHGR